MTNACVPRCACEWPVTMAVALKGLDFARALLEKYGWKDGKGLGRNEDGITQALKPKCKFDKAGIGDTGLSDQFTSRWWEKAYNNVAKNINVIEDEDDIEIQQESREELFKTKDARPFSMYNPTNYNEFVKTQILTGEGVIKITEIESNPGTSLEKDAPGEAGSCLTDEEIFRACGGRTVHKGARHGLNLNGKLSRIQRQEQELLQKYQFSQPTSKAADFEQKERKKQNKKSKIKSNLEGTTSGMESQCVMTSEEIEKKKDCLNILDDGLKTSKRKKRKKNIETECSEDVNAVDGSVNYTCSTLPNETNTDPQNMISEKKKKKKEYVEIEEKMIYGITDSPITDTALPDPPKKRKKKKIQNEDAQHSEITNLSLSEYKKKAKRKEKYEV